MYNSLKKYGLSDTKHQLKLHIDKCSAYRSSTKRTQPKQPISNNVTISQFAIADEVHMQNNTKLLVLDRLLTLLQRRERQPCLLNGHDRNPTKFICTQEGCINRIGCSYCFLEDHKNHSKMDSKEGLKMLGELKNKVDISRFSLKQMLITRKKQSMKTISTLLSQIRQAFDRQINYLQKKIEQSIESQFSSKMDQIQGKKTKDSINDIYRVQEQPQMTFVTERLQSEVKNKKDMSIKDIFQIYNSIDKSAKKQPGHINSRYKSKRYQTQSNNRGVEAPSSAMLGQTDEQSILQKLARLNIPYVQQYLHQQAFEMRQCVQYLKVYEQFYKQLNTSLQQFFNTFKSAIPCYRSIENCIPEPQILRGYSC